MDRRGFLRSCFIAAAAPAIVRVASLMPIRGPRIEFLSERSLEDAVIAIRSLTNDRGLLIATSPTVLWPGVKRWWNAAYQEMPINYRDLYAR